MFIVGWEGFFGFFYYCITLPILQYIPCTPSVGGDFCVFGVIEDTAIAFQQMGNNGVVLGCCIGTIFTIAFFNYFGVATTKYASAPQRSTVDTSRTVLIWIFFLTVPIKGAEEKFKWLQLIGFILLIFGTLVYNEILVIPFLGFNQWTKAAIAKREEENGEGKRKNSLKDTLSKGLLDSKDDEDRR